MTPAVSKKSLACKLCFRFCFLRDIYNIALLLIWDILFSSDSGEFFFISSNNPVCSLFSLWNLRLTFLLNSHISYLHYFLPFIFCLFFLENFLTLIFQLMKSFFRSIKSFFFLNSHWVPYCSEGIFQAHHHQLAVFRLHVPSLSCSRLPHLWKRMVILCSHFLCSTILLLLFQFLMFWLLQWLAIPISHFLLITH